jgi:3'-phosphoadenosine 5'-phosphosulfate sulfotransferase (PAPS reductase)/FAD synthetase
MNPFHIDEPTVISFSGGRTSAFMLYKVLEAHDMSLPEEAIVCFANTGKEDEATLQFVNDCAKAWNVKIHWLEYQPAELTKDRWKEVDFETASRDGEPF